MKLLEREREREKIQRLKDQAKDHFVKTLDTLWKSNDEPS